MPSRIPWEADLARGTPEPFAGGRTPAAFGWAYRGGLWAVPAAASDRSFPSLEQIPLFSSSCAALFAALLTSIGALSGYSHTLPRSGPRGGLASSLPRWRSPATLIPPA